MFFFRGMWRITDPALQPRGAGERGLKAVESWSRPDFFFGLRSVAFIGRVAARVSSARALRRATAAATVVGGTEICRRQRAAAAFFSARSSSSTGLAPHAHT